MGHGSGPQLWSMQVIVCSRVSVRSDAAQLDHHSGKQLWSMQVIVCGRAAVRSDAAAVQLDHVVFRFLALSVSHEVGVALKLKWMAIGYLGAPIANLHVRRQSALSYRESRRGPVSEAIAVARQVAKAAMANWVVGMEMVQRGRRNSSNRPAPL